VKSRLRTLLFHMQLVPLRIVLLSKRRAQLKQAVGAMVKEAMTYIDKAGGREGGAWGGGV
jgi:hypothetical protein